MFRSSAAPVPAKRRPWMNSVPLFVTLLVPLSMFAHDLRLTFAAGCVALGVQAVIARMLRGSLLIQIALAVGALGFAAALCYYSFFPRT